MIYSYSYIMMSKGYIMKKALCTATVLLIVIAAFAGCTLKVSQNNERSLNSNSRNGYSSITYDYKFSSKNDGETHVFELEKDGSIRIKLDSLVKEGKISFVLKNSDDEEIYESEGKRIDFNESFDLPVGSYTITFIYDDTEQGDVKMEIYSKTHIIYDDNRVKDEDSKEDKTEN